MVKLSLNSLIYDGRQLHIVAENEFDDVYLNISSYAVTKVNFWGLLIKYIFAKLGGILLMYLLLLCTLVGRNKYKIDCLLYST